MSDSNNIRTDNDTKPSISPINTIPVSKLSVAINNFLMITTNHLNKLSVSVDEKLQDFDKKLNDLEVMTTLLEAKLDSLPDDVKAQYPALQTCSLDDVNPVISQVSSIPSFNSNININNNRDNNNNNKSGSVSNQQNPQSNPNIPPVPSDSVQPSGYIPPPPGSGIAPDWSKMGNGGGVNNTNNSVGGAGGEGENKEEEVKTLTPEEELAAFLAEHEEFASIYKMAKIGIPLGSVQQKVTMNELDQDLFEQLKTIIHKIKPSFC